jgi:RNA polymerase sigma factor (TIGR02999 family)
LNQVATAPEITALLVAWSEGDHSALEQLMPLVYSELRRIARRHMRAESAGHALQTTALVHEAHLRLIEQRRVTWRNRAHFFAIAAQAMRRILVSMARARHAQKRAADLWPLELDEALVLTDERAQELVALDEALVALSKLDPRRGQVVELRYFGGLTVEETAEVLGTSAETVMRDWKRAKVWLRGELDGAAGAEVDR